MNEKFIFGKPKEQQQNFHRLNDLNALTQSNGTNDNLSGYKLPDYFRLDQAIEEFNFVKDEDLDNDKRFKMIMLRDQMEPEFRGFQMIPVYDRLIKRAQFDEYERRKQRELTGEEEVEKPNEKMSSTKLNQRMNQIDIVRNRGRKYVEKIRQKIIKEFRFAQSQKTLADMIFEEQMPNINAIGNLFWTLYVEPKRPLYPRRRERKKIKGQNISPDDVSILVTVVNAYSLPVRRENIRNDPMKTIKDPISGRTIRVHENIAGDSLVQPFVEVTFQEEVRRTVTANGPNASWNTELKFQFHLKKLYLEKLKYLGKNKKLLLYMNDLIQFNHRNLNF
ncbi:coiled-coil and C2 domain-containing 2A isoform X4 [Brachionus plicatilis]|uniref:Coiled-coil and C2 domain-containing 2A isoform X4 n=1 Tax=Brachionus plicatilis TaxID=10195 RepID=A0A3M7RB25_BRAPC|nr:coiled-coil and C2 domain-containing 2A isoform X4 [Brachionus plicatilis]